MKTYYVTFNVCGTIEANSEDEAFNIANSINPRSLETCEVMDISLLNDEGDDDYENI